MTPEPLQHTKSKLRKSSSRVLYEAYSMYSKEPEKWELDVDWLVETAAGVIGAKESPLTAAYAALSFAAQYITKIRMTRYVYWTNAEPSFRDWTRAKLFETAIHHLEKTL